MKGNKNIKILILNDSLMLNSSAISDILHVYTVYKIIRAEENSFFEKLW